MSDQQQRVIPIESIVTDGNIRSAIDEDKLQELAASLSQYGLMQPIVVREKHIEGKPTGTFDVISGHRRLSAAKDILGWEQISAIVAPNEVPENTKLAMQLVENLQREDVSPLDEAKAFKRLRDEFNMQQQEISKMVSKTEAYVSQRLSLLTLSHKLREQVHQGTLGVGKAVELAKIRNEEQQETLANELRNADTSETRQRVQDARTRVAGDAPPRARTIRKTTEIRHRYKIEERLKKAKMDFDDLMDAETKPEVPLDGDLTPEQEAIALNREIELLKWILIVETLEDFDWGVKSVKNKSEEETNETEDAEPASEGESEAGGDVQQDDNGSAPAPY